MESLNPIINQFKRFIDKAGMISELRQSGCTEEFGAFIGKAEQIVINQVRHSLAAHSKQLEALCRWITPSSCDILAIAGISRFEDPYTNLIKWMLYPPGRSDLALRCQKAWLKTLNIQFEKEIEEAIEPIVQFVTDDGRADLLIHFARQRVLLIIESKVSSLEHEVPSGSTQTSAYPFAVRKKLGLPDDYRTEMVFLSPDGIQASDQSAINATFEDFVTAIAFVLSPDEMDFYLRSAYAIIISHLLAHAAPFGFDKSEALRDLEKCIGKQAQRLSDEQIISKLGIIGPICRSLERGVKK